jgi:hypothetical protein
VKAALVLMSVFSEVEPVPENLVGVGHNVEFSLPRCDSNRDATLVFEALAKFSPNLHAGCNPSTGFTRRPKVRHRPRRFTRIETRTVKHPVSSLGEGARPLLGDVVRRHSAELVGDTTTPCSSADKIGQPQRTTRGPRIQAKFVKQLAGDHSL